MRSHVNDKAIRREIREIRDFIGKPLPSESNCYKLRPRIFYPKNDPPIMAYVETYDIEKATKSYDAVESFCIYWFHWHKDGIWNEQDYEPVITGFKDGKIQFVITRRHWEYQPYAIEDWGYKLDEDKALDTTESLEVIFDGMFHPPEPKTKDATDYILKRDCLESGEYELRNTERNFIDQKFRIGKGHISFEMKNIFLLGILTKRQVDDPYDHTTSYVKEHVLGHRNF
jgi:hypothetical protein